MDKNWPFRIFLIFHFISFFYNIKRSLSLTFFLEITNYNKLFISPQIYTQVLSKLDLSVIKRNNKEIILIEKLFLYKTPCLLPWNTQKLKHELPEVAVVGNVYP